MALEAGDERRREEEEVGVDVNSEAEIAIGGAALLLLPPLRLCEILNGAAILVEWARAFIVLDSAGKGEARGERERERERDRERESRE